MKPYISGSQTRMDKPLKRKWDVHGIIITYWGTAHCIFSESLRLRYSRTCLADRPDTGFLRWQSLVSMLAFGELGISLVQVPLHHWRQHHWMDFFWLKMSPSLHARRGQHSKLINHTWSLIPSIHTILQIGFVELWWSNYFIATLVDWPIWPGPPLNPTRTAIIHLHDSILGLIPSTDHE